MAGPGLEREVAQEALQLCIDISSHPLYRIVYDTLLSRTADAGCHPPRSGAALTARLTLYACLGAPQWRRRRRARAPARWMCRRPWRPPSSSRCPPGCTRSRWPSTWQYVVVARQRIVPAASLKACGRALLGPFSRFAGVPEGGGAPVGTAARRDWPHAAPDGQPGDLCTVCVQPAGVPVHLPARQFLWTVSLRCKVFLLVGSV